MAQYKAKGPDGRMYNFEGPAGLSDRDASFFLGQYFQLGADQSIEPPELKPIEPKAETGFIPSVKRGFAQTGMLLGDILPAMAARAVGADKYAEEQLKEAAQTQKDIEKKYPSAVPSFTDIKGIGDAVTYITEAVGESIPSILPGLFTGGAASVLGRGAVIAAKEAAEKAAMNSIAKGVATEEAEKIALQAGVEAAKRVALKYEAAGAVAGSAAQNIPDVYQNIMEATGKEDLGAALVAGGFNALLDSILPIQLLRKAKLSGIPEQEIIGAWYKRGAAGLGKGFLTEGGTEAVQEMSSAAAEKFVDSNQDFFTSKNLTRFIDAGLKGGLGGGVITGASDIAFGRAPTKAEETGVAPSLQDVADLEKQILAQQGIQVPEEAPAPAPAQTVVAPTSPTEVPTIAPGALDQIKPIAPAAPAVAETSKEAQLGKAKADLVQMEARGAPEPALNKKRKQIERLTNEIEAQKQTTLPVTEGAVNVGQPIDTTGGVGVPVSQPAGDIAPAAPGVAGVEPTGVVPAGADAAKAVAGEAEQPATVKADPIEAAVKFLENPKLSMITPVAQGLGLDTKTDPVTLVQKIREKVAEATDQTSEPAAPAVATPSRAPNEAWLKNFLAREELLNKADEVQKESEKLLDEFYALPLSEQHDSPLKQKRAELNAEHDRILAEIDALDAEREQLRTTPAPAPQVTPAPTPKRARKAAPVAEKGPAVEEIEKRDLTPEEEATVEADPLLENAIMDVQQGVTAEEFASTNDIPLERAEVLFDEAKRVLDQEGIAYSEPDAEIDAKENEALVEGPATGATTAPTTRAARKPKGQITAQGREARTGRPSIMGGKPVPAYTQRELSAGNSRAVLNMIRTAAPNPVHRAIAQHIYKAGLFPKINLVNSLPNGRVAQYNPKTREIDVTAQAMQDPGQVLHEFVHDASIKVLFKFLNGEKLTPTQQRAAEHLQFLMNESRGAVINPTTGATLGDVFPEAYENLYEFVSYGLTNEEFAKALSKLRIPEDRIYNRTASAFRRFVEAVARLVGFTDEEINTLSQKLGIAQEDVTQSQLVKEYGDAFDRLDFKTNTMSTNVFAAFLDIVAPPAASGYELPTMAVQEVKQAEPGVPQTDEEITQKALEQNELKEHGVRKKVSNLFTKRGAIWLTEHFQNDRYRLKRWEDRWSLLNRIDRITDKLNNVYGQITRSAGMGVDMFNTHMKVPTENAQKAVQAYADKLGIETRDALARLHLIMETRHEPERRRVKFILRVPLDNDNKIDVNSVFADPGIQALFSDTSYTANTMREEILKILSSRMNNLPEEQRKAYAKELRAGLDKIVDDKTNHPVIVKKASEKGKITERKTTDADFDENSEIYNVIGGRLPREIKAISKLLDTSADKAEIDAVADALKVVTNKSIELNKYANYFSIPTQNIVDFYGFQNYVPFKGRPGREQIDEEFEIGSRRIGGEMQEGQDKFGGRDSESENSILQTLADGASASLRAGRKDLTLAIKNAVDQKLMRGTLKDKITFEDRYLQDVRKQDMTGPDKIFHYNNDGTIDIIQINDKELSEAIRRQYRESSPVIDLVNRLTSGIGMMHTRYNPAFAPMNFVRDALTNAFTLGAEFGPAEAGRLLSQISSDVADGGMAKAMRYSVLYARGDFDKINELAAKDPYYKDMQEYVKLGGRVSYLQGVAAKGALDQLIEEVGYKKMGPQKIATLLRKKDIDKFLDIYNEMFELSSRVATFRVMRENITDKNQAKGMSPTDAAKDVTVQAVEYAKNLANFEQVGRWGKEAGSLFMFFRPAATGAVRAIEALAPAFMRFDEQEFRMEAKQSGATDEAIDKAVKTMQNRRASARRMAAGLAGLGMIVYWAAVMTAGDDDEGRNKVLTDDMARWTRYARFAIPGTDMFFQIPWGFGLGFFASFGAQMASVLSGRNSIADAIGNTIPTFLDSFMPLPISRISPVENFPAFVIDSALPSAARPFVEYMMNLDGLGREIYNNRQTRYGDAYTGGDNIPESYKAAARTIFNMTDGKIDISPNTLYFFASNYIDGIAKTATGVANMGMTAVGYKEADLRNDIPVLSSFFGTKSNVDAREFSKVEKQIQQMDKRINSLKDKPEMLDRYLQDHEQDYALVQFYNQAVNGSLRDLRTSANQIRANPDLSPKERKAELDEIIKLQNYVKRDLLNAFEAVGGITP